MHEVLTRAVTRYLAMADRLLPGRITGFYVVGSAALGAWWPRRSDIDFVAVTDGGLDKRELRRLRILHGAGNATAVARAVATADPSIPATMNGVFVANSDLGMPVTKLRPLASHSGRTFTEGAGFDANPVMWKVLAEHGIPVRGPTPDQLGLDPEPDRLRAWNLSQLRGHWRTWAARAQSPNPPRKPLMPAHRVALASVLGPPRQHHTIATGEVITKERAGEYALDTFAPRWHPLIRAALAQRAGKPTDPPTDNVPHLAGEFTHEVITTAERL